MLQQNYGEKSKTMPIFKGVIVIAGSSRKLLREHI